MEHPDIKRDRRDLDPTWIDWIVCAAFLTIILFCVYESWKPSS